MSARKKLASAAQALLFAGLLAFEAAAQQHDHSQMDHSQMDHGPMRAGTVVTPIPEPTDAERTAAFPALERPMEHVREFNSLLVVNRLEAWDADPGTAVEWEAQGWVGSDLNRLWLRSEGERTRGSTEAADIEALYGRSISPWWDVVAGLRQDLEPGDARSWAAFGVQGLSPYKFEIAATAYVGESGRMAARLEIEYELLLTNRLILQPLMELNAGSGLGGAEAGLRLRYEIRRRLAPYIGVVHERALGSAADRRRAEGESERDTRAVAGVRIWY
jgi:copper resistance protein B